MTTIYIAQLHVPGSRERDEFDDLTIANSMPELISKLKVDFAQRTISNMDSSDLPELDRNIQSLSGLLAITEPTELETWIDDNISYFSLSIRQHDF